MDMENGNGEIINLPCSNSNELGQIRSEDVCSLSFKEIKDNTNLDFKNCKILEISHCPSVKELRLLLQRKYVIEAINRAPSCFFLDIKNDGVLKALKKRKLEIFGLLKLIIIQIRSNFSNEIVIFYNETINYDELINVQINTGLFKALEEITLENVKILWNFFCEVFDDAEERKKIIMQKDIRGNNIFFSIFEQTCDHKVEFILPKVYEIMGKEIFKEFLIMRNNDKHPKNAVGNYFRNEYSHKSFLTFIESKFSESEIRNILIDENSAFEIKFSKSEIRNILIDENSACSDEFIPENIFGGTNRISHFLQAKNYLTKDELKILMKSEKQYYRTFLHYVVENNYEEETFDTLWEIYKETFSDEEFKEIAKHLLNFTAYRWRIPTEEILDSLIQKFKKYFNNETLKRIFDFNTGFRALDLEKVKIIWNFFDEVFDDAAERKEIIMQNDIRSNPIMFSFVHMSANTLEFILPKIYEIMGKKEFKNELLYSRNIDYPYVNVIEKYFRSKNYNKSFLKFIESKFDEKEMRTTLDAVYCVKFREDIFNKLCHNRMLHYLQAKNYLKKDELKILMRSKYRQRQKRDYEYDNSSEYPEVGDRILQYVVANIYEEQVFDDLWETYKETFSDEEFNEIVLTTGLFVKAVKNPNPNFIIYFVQKLKKHFIGNTETLKIIFDPVDGLSEAFLIRLENFEFLWNFFCDVFDDAAERKELVVEMNSYKNFLYYIVNRDDKDIEFILPKIYEILGKELFKEFIIAKPYNFSYIRNAIELYFQSDHSQKSFLTFIESKFSKSEIRNILIDGNSACPYNFIPEDIFEKTCKNTVLHFLQAKNYLTTNELKILMRSEDQYFRTILECTALSVTFGDCIETFEDLWETYEETFSDEEFYEIVINLFVAIEIIMERMLQICLD